MLKIHAVQTGTVAIKSRQVRGEGHGLARQARTLPDRRWTAMLPITVWVIEHPEGLIVVDTGETAQATLPGYFPRWHPYYRLGLRLAVRPEDEIGPQLRARGLSPDAVRWVVLTHLHTDHAGGLAHFPHAEIVVSRAEYDLASGLEGRLRGYLPNRWPAWFAPRLLAFDPIAVEPFTRSHALTQAGDIVLVSTLGHTAGHLSVIVRDGEHTLFLAGDTSYTEQTLLDNAVDGVSPDEDLARTTLRQIRLYARDVPTVYLPSHDPGGMARLAARRILPQRV